MQHSYESPGGLGLEISLSPALKTIDGNYFIIGNLTFFCMMLIGFELEGHIYLELGQFQDIWVKTCFSPKYSPRFLQIECLHFGPSVQEFLLNCGLSDRYEGTA